MKSCIQKYSSFVNFIDRAHFLGGVVLLGCVSLVTLFFITGPNNNLVQAMFVCFCESPFS